MPKPDYDLMMGLIRQHFNRQGREALTFTRWKDGIDVDYPTVAIELFAEAVAAHAFEAAAKVADNYRRDGTNPKEYAVETADELATRIRALKSQPLT